MRFQTSARWDLASVPKFRLVYRIEVGARGTRRRTLRTLAAVLTDEPDAIVTELVALGGPALAPESPWAERIESRPLKRLRRTEGIAEREGYATERAHLGGQVG